MSQRDICIILIQSQVAKAGIHSFGICQYTTVNKYMLDCVCCRATRDINLSRTIIAGNLPAVYLGIVLIACGNIDTIIFVVSDISSVHD